MEKTGKFEYVAHGLLKFLQNITNFLNVTFYDSKESNVPFSHMFGGHVLITKLIAKTSE